MWCSPLFWAVLMFLSTVYHTDACYKSPARLSGIKIFGSFTSLGNIILSSYTTQERTTLHAACRHTYILCAVHWARVTSMELLHPSGQENCPTIIMASFHADHMINSFWALKSSIWSLMSVPGYSQDDILNLVCKPRTCAFKYMLECILTLINLLMNTPHENSFFCNKDA